MRVVLDTNILISSLITKNTPPAHICDLWLEGMFTLAMSQWQLQEFERVRHYPKLQRFINVNESNTLAKAIAQQSHLVEHLPIVNYSPDSDDNFILASAIAAQAQYVVTGDKNDLLHLQEVEGIEIVTARDFLQQVQAMH